MELQKRVSILKNRKLFCDEIFQQSSTIIVTMESVEQSLGKDCVRKLVFLLLLHAYLLWNIY